MPNDQLPSMIDAAAFPQHWQIQARFSDLDPNGHVNNIAVAEMFSEGRNAFIRQMFTQTPRPTGFHFVVGQSAVRYLAEALWPHMFTIGTGILAIGTKSMRLGQAFFMQGRCLSVAEAVLVARQGRGTVVLQGDIRDHLERQRLRDGLLPRQLI